MKVLLDECVPARLRRVLSPHEIATVRQMGWAGIKNGALLALAAPEFDAFVTVDRKLPHEQKLAQFSLRVILLRAKTNRLEHLLPLAPRLLDALHREDTNPLTVIGD